MEKIKLNENDWNAINKGQKVKIGQREVTVTPFSIESIMRLKTVLQDAVISLKKQGVSGENVDTPESMLLIFKHIATSCPVIIEEACGLDKEDIPRLPVATGIALIAAVIQVNIESQEGLFDLLTFIGTMLTSQPA